MTTTQASLSKRGKRYQAAAKEREHQRQYSPEEAVELVKKMATAKFDEAVELHIRTAADPKRSDHAIRGVVVLPHGIGKSRRVLVFAQSEVATAAREAGADYVADDEIIRRIEQEGWVDFDVAVATPDMMGRIGRLGRVLGRRGLMPNPKAGTVVQPQDLPRVVAEAKKGRVEFRMDRTALIHVAIGKASFPAQSLADNLAAILDAISKARPEGVKGQFVRSIYLTSSMGPSVSLDVNKALALRPA